MPEGKTITVATGRSRTELEVHEIHYVLMKRNYANIHICYPTFKGHCGCILFNLDAADGQLNALNL